MQLEIDTSEIKAFETKLKNAYQTITRGALDDFRSSQSQVTRRTYQDASKRTPYADGHKGSFGIVTGRFLEDISQVKRIGNSAEQSSDLAYARRLEQLFIKKGTLKSVIPQSDKLLVVAIEANIQRYFE